jgi:hypothetical protein
LQSLGQFSVTCCTVFLSVSGNVDVANGASARVSDDPPTLNNLPAGWTYTVTPVPVPLSLFEAAVPEPSTAALFAAGLGVLSVARRQRTA